MAVIYLKHPLHGGKVASTDIEAAHDRENGWEDFDPYEDVSAALPAFLAPPTGTPLPSDFPGRDALVKADFSTVESLAGKTYEQLQEIAGIGPALARKILDAQ